MPCLSCEFDLPDAPLVEGYHEKCAHRIFSVDWVPKIKFSWGEIALEAQKLVGKMSISGVQPKLSVKLVRAGKALQVIAQGGSHILKPSPGQFPHLAENENMCMNLAGEAGIETPPHGLLPLSDGNLVYIVRRFDRSFEKMGTRNGYMSPFFKIHTEDFAQILGETGKYKGSVEQIGDALKKYSEIPFIDTQKLFLRTLFNFLIGNGDAHLKNFSMLRRPGKGYRLSEAYDILSSRLVLAGEAEEMAITVNGKRNNIRMKDFIELAGNLEIPEKQYMGFLKTLRGLKGKVLECVEKGFLPEAMKERFLSIFSERFARLFG